MILSYILIAVLTKTYFSSEVPIPEIQSEEPHSKGHEHEITDEKYDDNSDKNKEEKFEESSDHPKLIEVENKPGYYAPSSHSLDSPDKTDSSKDDVATDSKDISEKYQDLGALVAEFYRRSLQTAMENYFPRLRKSLESSEENEEEHDHRDSPHTGRPVYVHPRSPSGELKDRIGENERGLFIKLKIFEFVSILLANVFTFAMRICEMFKES
ncbi:hypothetical protein RF11_09802 [Thelohanellus kitauei]|uniref:Uncharacterized protein n=1 Tax=Thelohanellus kitauei TaxID=669202 RepID=A0A0C2J618_THEKT|nr:hypothetical protein RF11_09802 [Thelohanellus kitauei]